MPGQTKYTEGERRILDLIHTLTLDLTARDSWLNLQEAAREVKHSKRTIQRWIQEGKLKASDAAGIRIRKSELNRFMEKNEVRQ